MRKLWEGIKRAKDIDDIINVSFLGFMTVIIFVQIIFRYVLNRSISWSEELAILMFIWICFLGASALNKRNGHFGFDNFVLRLPIKAQLIVGIFGDVVSCFFIACLMIGGVFLVISGKSHVTGALEIEMWIVYFVIPVAGLMYLMRLVGRILDKLKLLR